MSVAVIVGSAFGEPALEGRELVPEQVRTRHGEVTLYSYPRSDGEAWLLPRHGLPHRYLPHQIPYRAHAAALAEVGCEALLLTSSVGVIDRDLPLEQPLIVLDLVMATGCLPDGSACTMFPEPGEGQGHLVVNEGLFSKALSEQVARMAIKAGAPPPPRVVFGWFPGPRTKTRAENALWRSLGAQVDSQTVAPETVLANELGIPTAALVVGHKRSSATSRARLDREEIARSLEATARVINPLAAAFLADATAVPFGNFLYRL